VAGMKEELPRLNVKFQKLTTTFMKNVFLFIFLLTSVITYAQKASKPDAYAKSINVADLKKHLYIIASKEMEGRETATEGQRKAAAYLENEFKRIGLLPGNDSSYQQYFNVYQDSIIETSIEVNGQRFAVDKDFNAAGNNTSSIQAFSEVIYIPKGLSIDSLKNIELAGRLVIVTDNSKSGLLYSRGAAAVLTISNNYPRNTPAFRRAGATINFFKRAMGPQQFTVSESLVKSMSDNYEEIKNGSDIKILKANVLLNVQKATRVLQSSNVLGILPGTDLKDEYLFITAHYDHLGKRDTVIYYGADDDGSGTVAVVEMAEAFAKAKTDGKGPRRSIVFMAVSGEEKGLWGSEFYGNNPVYPLSKTTADLNIDMIGRSDSSRKGDTLNYVYVVGDDKISSELKPLSEAQNKKYTKLKLDYKFNDPKDPHNIYYRSDHYSFAKHGVPIIFYYDGMLGADYHRPTDTPDKINYPLLMKRAQLVFYTAWEMANRNEMLKRDIELPVLRR